MVFSFLGLFINKDYLLSSLLCLEGLRLGVVSRVFFRLRVFEGGLWLSFFLSLAVCEAALGLTLLVVFSRGGRGLVSGLVLSKW